MSNMAYCRFQNTLRDLQDCYEHMHDTGLSVEEAAAMDALQRLCLDIAVEYGGIDPE
jgi:hypothetical protein